jgi:hypothetical protein
VPYSSAVSKLRCPFLSDRYFFIAVRLLRRREKFTQPDFALLGSGSVCCSGALRAPELLENSKPAVRDRRYKNQTDPLPPVGASLQPSAGIAPFSHDSLGLSPRPRRGGALHWRAGLPGNDFTGHEVGARRRLAPTEHAVNQRRRPDGELRPPRFLHRPCAMSRSTRKVSQFDVEAALRRHVAR